MNDDQLSDLKVAVRVNFEVELPEPERDNRGVILGVLALALSLVALCVSVFG